MRSRKKSQDLLIKLGEWGGGQKGIGRRKEKWGGEDEGSERSSWGEDRDRE